MIKILLGKKKGGGGIVSKSALAFISDQSLKWFSFVGKISQIARVLWETKQKKIFKHLYWSTDNI